MLEAACRGRAGQAPVLIDLRILRRETLDAGRAPEAAGIQREAVGGEVIGPPVQDRLDEVAGDARLAGPARRTVGDGRVGGAARDASSLARWSAI